MELFTLLAKLTLDTSDYDQKISSAKTKTSISIQDPKLGLDKTDFDQGITDAEGTVVTDPTDPQLDLDTTPFDTSVTDANDTQVDDPNEPELDLDTSEFEDGVKEAEALGEGFGSTMSSVFSELSGVIAAAGITGAVAGIINFLKQGINLAKEHGDAIDKQSQKLNLSKKSYQELDYALTLSGASVTDLTRAMRTFTEIQGGKLTDDQTAYFEKLGISAKDASGQMKDAETLMTETMYALADYKGDDRGLIMEAFFGRNSAGLNAFFNNTSDKIKEMRQEANDLGIVMSDEEVQNAANYMDATTRLEKALDGLKESFAAEILPLLTDATNAVARIVGFFTGRTQSNNLSDQFADTDEQLADDILTINATSSAAMDLIEKLQSMGSAEKLTAEQQAEWKATANWLIENIPSLSSVIDIDTQSIKGNKDEIYENITAWQKLAIERAKAEALKDKRQALTNKTTEWLKKEEEAAEAYAEYEKSAAKVEELLKRDFGNMDAGNKQKFLQKFGYENEDAIDWTSGSKIYQQLENAFINYSEWGINGGSRELLEAASKRDTGLNSDYQKWQKAREEADALKKEVETGKTNLALFETTLDDVILSMADSGNQAEESAKQIKKFNDEVLRLKGRRIGLGDNAYTLLDPMNYHAKGLNRVPFDNYPALLHRDEEILSATEARRYREGTGAVDFSGMEDRIIAAIRAGMENATVRSYLNGREITDEVSRELTNQAAARRYR